MPTKDEIETSLREDGHGTVMDSADVSDALRCSKRTVRRLKERGELRATESPGHPKYLRADVAAFIASASESVYPD